MEFFRFFKRKSQTEDVNTTVGTNGIDFSEAAGPLIKKSGKSKKAFRRLLNLIHEKESLSIYEIVTVLCYLPHKYRNSKLSDLLIQKLRNDGKGFRDLCGIYIGALIEDIGLLKLIEFFDSKYGYDSFLLLNESLDYTCSVQMFTLDNAKAFALYFQSEDGVKHWNHPDAKELFNNIRCFIYRKRALGMKDIFFSEDFIKILYEPQTLKT